MRLIPQLPTSAAAASSSPAGSPPAAGRGMAGAYPWLLLLSTTLSGVFCYLYLTKPVIVSAAPSQAAPVASGPVKAASVPAHEAPPSAPALLPDQNALPGDNHHPQAIDPRTLAAGGAEKAFEETNLRVQHVLGAQGPAGEDLGRVVLNVPVVYRSRTLRWTPAEIARARQLMTGIADYQERSRALRDEGGKLLAAWNELITASIPAESLRADSPSLPGNQNGGAGGGNLDTIESIKINR